MAKKAKKEKTRKKQDERQSQDATASSTQDTETITTCDLTGCGQFAGARLPCCMKRICPECCFRAVTVCTCDPEPKFQIKCAFCRGKIRLMDDTIVKDMMHRFCPSYAKVMENPCLEGRAIVAHLPCDGDCYECNDSTIRVIDL